MPSEFAGEFTETTLTYQLAAGEATEDDTGKETISSTPRTVTAYLKTPRAPNVRSQIGADTVFVSYEGRLIDPTSPPEGFVTGTHVTFEMDGRTVKGRMIVFAPSPVPDLDEELGRRIQVSANG